jgi:hypothetical protein
MHMALILKKGESFNPIAPWLPQIDLTCEAPQSKTPSIQGSLSDDYTG